ncbi:Cof-type HAD-IIB family hydrolase [Alicyclobacillus pomorum]|jgi:Cof subfamily protein (haloacid dehalogenase superfamily)|uniref:Cof-type HAD-IIB family hydrolase n=1 Tax=Alicyclobacillus pomorum TaxID=204470 RepID=UPI0004064684|nr:Cof-type HAD-IIB family hydrolase [Alicyclobacillus pomorum]
MKEPLFFAIDIDGTLLNSRQTVDEPTWAAIQRAMHEGHYVSLATGRMAKSALVWARYLQINAPVVTQNGAEIIDAQTGAILWCTPLAKEPLLKLIHLAENADLTYRLFGHDYIVCATDHFEHLKPFLHTYYKGTVVLSEDDVPKYLERPPEAILKATVGCHSERELLEVYQELKSWNAFELSRTPDMEIEITQHGVNKLSGIQRVIRDLKLSLEHVVAIGNGENDLEMLRHVGVGYAMANAEPVVLQSISLRTASNDESGVAKAIEHELGKRGVKFA